MASNTLPSIPFEADVYQAFVRGLRGVWRGDAYRATVSEARAADVASVRDLEAAMTESTAYQLYGWLERRSQQFKYLGRWGMVRWLDRQEETLDAILREAERMKPERLRLDPAFEVPDYVLEADTHQHPRATWDRDVSAFVYEWATESSSFSLGDADRPQTWYAQMLAETFKPTRALDIGCSAGKSSRALKRAVPDAQVHACDVAAPLLKLAHLRAVEGGLDITFWQRSAEDLKFEATSFDLVSSHWLFHEMPQDAIRRALREMRRVLKTGGGISIYDMYLQPGGLVGDWLHAGYSARNNEPFGAGFSAMALCEELESAGFENTEIRISDIQQADFGGPDPLPAARTHPMTVVTARAKA